MGLCVFRVYWEGVYAVTDLAGFLSHRESNRGLFNLFEEKQNWILRKMSKLHSHSGSDSLNIVQNMGWRQDQQLEPIFLYKKPVREGHPFRNISLAHEEKLCNWFDSPRFSETFEKTRRL